ncbi:DUF1330 domain-containing protein [Teredinibacter sp. KSP-S5-2]|uniref:DUF1330 domain-containing protein n=1 Tax=Teredinibacter sp. KSP-S5-2 TaxID=3034506 RepID=UPI002934D312|nr:DUF1330 domain-containing protein [Teredinibacter sp. KSP-S5-2]WNO11542.1 DUF1330 domain-containing protein [Teredinibacter sp. KSP-S5-2]
MKGYLVLDLTVNNYQEFVEYIEKIPVFIHKHGGRYIVQGVEPELMEGDWLPDRLIVLEFPSTGHARAFLADPDAQPLFAIRHKTTKSQLILAEGCTE